MHWLILSVLVSQSPPAAAEEIEEIEEVVDVEALDAGGTAAEAASPPERSLVGYFHPAAVHFPIAWLLLLFAVELGAIAWARRELLLAGYLLAVLAVASFVPAALTGFLRYAEHAAMGQDMANAAVHRNVALAAAVLTLVIAALRHLRGRQGFAGGTRWLYLALVAGATALVSVTGHLGGVLAFGAPPW